MMNLRHIVFLTLLLTPLSPALAEALKIDFNGSSGQTAAGFQAYTAQNEVANTFGSRSYSAFGGTVSITPSWSGSPATNTAQQAQARASLNGYSAATADMPDLFIDWIGTDTREVPGDPMTLTIRGLPAGKYGWISYHHDTQDQHGTFNVTLNDASGSRTTTGLQISSTQASSPPVTNLAGVTTFSTTITSDGVNPVTLLFDLTSSTSPVSTAFFVMNGFQITNDTVVQASAPLRRPISPSQPMWLVHIDSWNYADPQKIIDLIPHDIRPYVVMNISLSISHNTTTGQFQVSEYGYEIAKSWMRVCAQNNMWTMIQQSSGGYHHFSDFDLSVYREFYQNYPNFIGFNYAEQFWGYDDPNDPLSPRWVDRINHFANLLKLSHQYGGYLVVSMCWNQWGQSINPIGMLKRNSAFAAACRDYTENYILEEKYTQTGYQSDMESLCLGAYLSGYSGQYGIRYDSTGWTDSTGTNQNFTLASGGAPHLEHIMLTGQTVIDGPELIWTQCFRELSRGSTTDGYSMRRWQTFPQFDNVNVDLFRKILDGTIRIPSRQEVINRTKYIIVQDVNSGSDDARYSSPDSLFEGLYRMNGDGNYQYNRTFFKKTGRYPTFPVAYLLDDTLANSFQLKINKSAYAARWPSIAAKTNELNTIFPAEYTGDLYAGRHENGWVTYNPYKTNITASANIPFKYNTCESMDLTYSQYSYGVIREYSNTVTFYLGNYDNVLDTGLKTDTIKIHGSTTEPTYSWADRGNHQASVVTKSWLGGVFTLTIQHNGPLDVRVNCEGVRSGRLTAYTPASLVPPVPPMLYAGPRQYEGECFDYKSIAGITTSGYSGAIRNYTGQGYLNFGTSSSAAVRDTVNVLKNGVYILQTRYAVTGANVSSIDLYVNGVKVGTPVFTQTASLSNWAVNERNITLNTGDNTIEFKANGSSAAAVYFDSIVVTPTTFTDGLVIQETAAGFEAVDGTVDTAYPDYTGLGYANTADTNGASIFWNMTLDASPIKAFTFRYAAVTDSTAELIINGTNVASNIQFPSTGSFASWAMVTVHTYSPAGVSNVRLRSSSNTGLPNIDYLEMVGTTSPPPPPSGLVASAGNGEVRLNWNGVVGATSYNVKRSTTSGTGYLIVTNIPSTSFTDAGLVNGVTCYYLVSSVNAGGEGDNSSQVSATPVGELSGTVIGSAGSWGGGNNTIANVFDGNLSTYYDAVNGTGDWAGVDLGSGTVGVVTQIKYCPRATMASRMVGGQFQGANIANFSSGVVTLFTITATPPDGVMTAQTITNTTPFRYLRYIGPPNGFCNVAEVEFSGSSNKGPSLAPVPGRSLGVGMVLAITNMAADPDTPTQTLTFSLPVAPTNAVIDSASGLLTWRPLVTQANSVHPFTVVVSDNGTPILSATQSFTVTVTNFALPQVSSTAMSDGKFVFKIEGASGPDYQIQSSTNFVDWNAAFTTNSPAMPFIWTNNSADAPMRFFRVLAGPPLP